MRYGSTTLPGFIRPVGVPDRLELAERLDDLVAEHLRQELGPRLAVAVLARERAAVARRTRSAASSMKRAEVLDALGRVEVEVDARVDAALAEVAVERRS